GRRLGCVAGRCAARRATRTRPPAHPLVCAAGATAMSNVQITPAQLARKAAIYIRQSSPGQVLHNKESQRLQYGLAERAVSLGWPRSQVMVIDEDLGVSGRGGGIARIGFERLVAEVGLGHIGIVVSTEVSRMARNNRDWYHLLDLCALVDTLVADADGLYHPAVFNDRLLLGLKGTMSEALCGSPHKTSYADLRIMPTWWVGRHHRVMPISAMKSA